MACNRPIVEGTTTRDLHSKEAQEEDEKADSEEVWAKRALQRMRQIEIGKARPEYEHYARMVPKSEREENQPMTPDHTSRISKRAFDRELSSWRRHLHEFEKGVLGSSAEGEAAQGSTPARGTSNFLDGRSPDHRDTSKLSPATESTRADSEASSSPQPRGGSRPAGQTDVAATCGHFRKDLNLSELLPPSSANAPGTSAALRSARPAALAAVPQPQTLAPQTLTPLAQQTAAASFASCYPMASQIAPSMMNPVWSAAASAAIQASVAAAAATVQAAAASSSVHRQAQQLLLPPASSATSAVPAAATAAGMPSFAQMLWSSQQMALQASQCMPAASAYAPSMTPSQSYQQYGADVAAAGVPCQGVSIDHNAQAASAMGQMSFQAMQQQLSPGGQVGTQRGMTETPPPPRTQLQQPLQQQQSAGTDPIDAVPTESSASGILSLCSSTPSPAPSSEAASSQAARGDAAPSTPPQKRSISKSSSSDSKPATVVTPPNKFSSSPMGAYTHVGTPSPQPSRSMWTPSCQMAGYNPGCTPASAVATPPLPQQQQQQQQSFSSVHGQLDTMQVSPFVRVAQQVVTPSQQRAPPAFYASPAVGTGPVGGAVCTPAGLQCFSAAATPTAMQTYAGSPAAAPNAVLPYASSPAAAASNAMQPYASSPGFFQVRPAPYVVTPVNSAPPLPHGSISIGASPPVDVERYHVASHGLTPGPRPSFHDHVGVQQDHMTTFAEWRQ